MRVLAIHSDQGTHDSSCCIYDGEKIIYFLEERYSGIKHDVSLDYCLFHVLETNLKFDKIVVSGYLNSKVSNNNNLPTEHIIALEKQIPDMLRTSNFSPAAYANYSADMFLNMSAEHKEIYKLPDHINSIKIKEEWSKISNNNKKFILKYYNKYNHFPDIEYDSSHHLSHASIAFYNSGFDKSIVFVADGAGEATFSTSDNGNFFMHKELESLYVCEYPNTFKSLYKNYGSQKGHNFSKEFDRLKLEQPDCEVHISNVMGLGLMYGSGANQIGEDMDEAGKAMGLSSYGNATGKKYIIDDLFVNTDMFECHSHEFVPLLEPKKGFPKNYYYKPVGAKTHVERGGPENVIYSPDLPVLNILTRKNYQPFADYAKDLQLQTQEVAVKLIRKAIEKTGLKRVCVTGGYGMNILANSLYVKEFPDVEFYFEPLSIDASISIGCAMHHYRIETGDCNIKQSNTICFHGMPHKLQHHIGECVDITEIAKILFDNKSVAVFTGLAEAGQRALGNRSIFFNALNMDAKNLVNKVKKREWYRPFAAVVLEEDAHLYFDMGTTKRNLFMTQSFDVITDLIPGVTHVDNTCRVQTVSEGYLYDLLLEFKKLSGHGILLNTSFNLAGKPLVETPKQAIDTLNNSALDYLWFEETGQLIS
jgi:carbamoyltransferase